MTTRPIKPGRTRPDALSRPPAQPLQLAPLLDRLCWQLIERLPALHGLDAHKILIVAGQARGTARASIRSLTAIDQPLSVRVAGQRKLFELCLRPLWFRQSTPDRRLESLVHELWHIDPGAPDRLAGSRQHAAISRSQVAAAVSRLSHDAAALLDPATLAGLAFDGLVLLPAWLTRPLLTGEPQQRRRFGDRDLYLQQLAMITPLPVRTKDPIN